MDLRTLIFTSAISLPLALHAVPLTIQDTLSITAPGATRAMVGQTIELDFTLQNQVASPTTFDLYDQAYRFSTEISSDNNSFISLTQPDGSNPEIVTPAAGSPWLNASLAANNSGNLKLSVDLTGAAAGNQNIYVRAVAPGGTPIVDDTVSAFTTITAVNDRVLTSNATSLGRYMAGNGVELYSGATTVQVTSSGHDGDTTKLKLGPIDTAPGALTASHAGNVDFKGTLFEIDPFFGTPLVANVTLTATDLEIDTDAGLGYKTETVDIGSAISNGEATPLVGQVVQTELNVGFEYNVLGNNKLDVKDLLIIESADYSGTRNYATSDVGLEQSTSTHTDLGYVSSTAEVSTSDNFSAGTLNTIAENQVVQAVAEAGVIGAQDISASNDTFTAKVATFSAATFTATDVSTVLSSGDSITITDTGSGGLQNTLQGASSIETNYENYELSGAGRNDIFDSLNGGSYTVGINYTGNSDAVDAGGLTRVAKGTARLFTIDVVNVEAIKALAGFDSNVVVRSNPNDLPSSQTFYNLETRIEAAAAATGSAAVSNGQDFGVDGLALSNTAGNTDARFSDHTTQVELLDSGSLSATNVTLSFVSLANAGVAGATGAGVNGVAALESAGSNAGSVAGMYQGFAGKSLFVSDIVQVTGLDGQLHVLEIGYDGSFAALDALDNESAAQIVWATTYNDGVDPAEEAWINAVLGNKNIANLDLIAGTLDVTSGLGAVTGGTIEDYLALTRYVGSYADYLAEVGSPELGAWGVDVLNDQAWAVIDHNSDFAAAVPEPTTYALIAGVLVLAASVVRRRR